MFECLMPKYFILMVGSPLLPNLVICASACERHLPHAPHELAKYKAGPENDWQAGLDERPGLWRCSQQDSYSEGLHSQLCASLCAHHSRIQSIIYNPQKKTSNNCDFQPLSDIM